MADQTTRRPFTLPFVSVADLRQNAATAFLLDWGGMAISAVVALIGALYYVQSTAALRPLYDDSYITLTFARNLAEHGKLTFDGVHWSTGATSPLHVFLLATLLKLGVAPFFASMAFGVVCQVVLAAGVYLLTWSIFRDRLAALCGGCAIALTSYATMDAGNGLETGLFMSLLAFGFASYFLAHTRRARIIPGVLIGLAVLTRPEGMFLIPAVLVYHWIERPQGQSLIEYVKDAVALAGPGCVAIGGMLLFSLAVNGSFGGTANAKLHFFQEYHWHLEDKISTAADQVGLFIGPIIPLIALAFITAKRREALFIAFFWVPVLMFYVLLFPGGLAHYFYRYQHPTLPFIAAFAGAGFAYLVQIGLKNRDIVVKALVVAALLIVTVPMWKQYERWHDVYYAGSTETYQNLEAMAKDLNTIVKPGQTLATHDIGAVGYFADYKVLDLVGLVNGDVIKYNADREIPAYVEQQKPDYLLIFSDWDQFFLHLDAANQPERYELIKQYPGGTVRTEPYMLYKVHYN